MITLALTFEWYFVSDNSDELVDAIRPTLQMSVIAIAGAFVIGLVLGAARAARIPVVRTDDICDQGGEAARFRDLAEGDPLGGFPLPAKKRRAAKPPASGISRKGILSADSAPCEKKTRGEAARFRDLAEGDPLSGSPSCVKKRRAASYSPGGLRPEYHRRWRA